MNNIKDNKLIAEFIGYKKRDYRDGTSEYYIEEYCEYGDDGWFFSGNMGYHSSWDWLMPVITKCFQSDLEGINPFHADIKRELINTNIQFCYIAVLEFIKWYNKEGI